MPDHLPPRTLSLRPVDKSTAYAVAPVITVRADAVSEDTVELTGFWKDLRYRWRLVTFVGLVGALIGLAICFKRPVFYEAAAVLEIQAPNDTFLRSKDLDPVASDIESHFPTQIELMESRSLLRRVVQKLRLLDHPEFKSAEPQPSMWQKWTGQTPPKPLPLEEHAIAVLQQNLTINPVGMTRLVQVRYRSPDAKITGAVPNVVAQEYIDQSIEGRSNTIGKTGEWLSRELSDLKEKLESSERRLQDYAKTNELVFITDNNNNVSEEKLRQLQTELSQAYSDRIQKQSLYEITNDSQPQELPKVLQNPILNELQTRIVDMRRELALLQSTLTPEHYKVKRVEAQLKELEASMQNERAKLVARMKSDYQTAKLRETMLTEAYKRQTALVSNQAYKSIEYNLLKGEAEANRQLYEQMLGKVKEAGITSALRTGTARVVDSADTPVNPIAPNFLMASGLGLLGGLLLGSVFAVFKERVDSSVKGPGENATGLNVPEIGVIPLAGTEPKQLGQSKAYGLTASGRLELLTWEQRDSFVAESFRSTLHSLIGNHGSPQLHRVVAITSPNSMEGKTTVATNIAIAFAEAGVRVLLVDGDLRRPRLHDVFDVERGPGLTDLLTATELTDELLKTTIHQTNVAGVHLLTSGTQREMITALLYSERMNPLLEKLRQTFHFVLIDTPPTLPVPDARVIGAKCDGVVIVTAAGQTDRKEILLTGQRFAEDRTRVLGTILNKWVPRCDMAHYYRSYANSYLRSSD